jgi:hypothetical protein
LFRHLLIRWGGFGHDREFISCIGYEDRHRIRLHRLRVSRELPMERAEELNYHDVMLKSFHPSVHLIEPAVCVFAFKP